MIRPLRIAMLAHSTNPRGGVVHAMQLSEALTILGHEVVLHAPDAKGTGFFRTPACGTMCIPVEPAPADMTAMVERRISDYVRHFESSAARHFDIFHAHDGISGNALATLKQHSLIPFFARTVHHIDQFADPRLMELQDRSIDPADIFFTVSAAWQRVLWDRGLNATVVGNGVDVERFAPVWSGEQTALRDRLKLPPGPIFLSIGGVEARKNTIGILEAFRQLLAVRPDALLVVAGGASLLDHSGYQEEFRSELALLHDNAAAVHLIGPVADDDMPNLYRLADALVFPSLKEGFGLVVLEAMASGVPVIVSSIAPFTEYLTADDAIWCDPHHPASIAEAMALSLVPRIRERVIPCGLEVAGRFSWRRVAEAHLSAYATLKEAANA
ncbi:MSMEG_0565 family glycosyltransferase [Neorhizobium sp. Rsf11]|uniref:MSMEG_0565 family glycosyltransferase n=2 Tax=Neorhizobium TaxID=1525371 RepID=A0ABV0M255_9HYPH|nr:MSMEG_0565 family glycosyltransferase [Neorhizobium petrolearium]MCC2612025.1 MSMEG_0565 family glycosyltransferase [Neorhizobium petrolearium]WGI67185.1 MSMEG_0565 family glycosyltransferase [Neorhizobium petrolearium]